MIIFASPLLACTVFYAANSEMALAGNNEDYINPLTKVWFEVAENGKYGGVYFGFDNFVSESLPFELLKKYPWNWLSFGFETDLRALIYRWTYHSIIFQLVKKWIINSRKKNQPFFIFINYFDAHLPHNPPQPFRDKFIKRPCLNVDFEKLDDCLNRRFGFPYITEEVEIKKRLEKLGYL